MQGWIRIHRKIRNNPIFNNPQLLRLWLICLTEASHKEHERIVGKQTVKLQPGEFVTGRFDLMEMYNFGLKSTDKVKGEKTVFRWLELLERGGFLTIKKTNKFSIVSIDKWALYQDSKKKNDQQKDQQKTSKRPTNDQQMTTNNNVNNVLKDFSRQEFEESIPDNEEIFVDEGFPKEEEKPGKKKKPKSKKYKYTDIDMELTKLLFTRMLENNPSHKPPNFESWADTVRLTREQDKRTVDQIRYVIEWSQQDDFWKYTLLSTGKLRSKFDMMVMKIKQEHEAKKNSDQQNSGMKYNNLDLGDLE